MSLLMQALKKAERARQSGLQEEEVPEATHEREAPASALGLHDADLHDAGLHDPDLHDPDLPPARPAGGLELSLEPLDERSAPPVRMEPSMEPAPPPATIEPALEAAHNPVPRQARHEGGRARPDPEAIPVADARAAPRPDSEAPRRAPGAPERRAVPRPTVERDAKAAGIDVARLRVAGLSGLLVIVAATFGYLYWQALNGPGPGASLPMVPMPPPSATGATNAAGAGGDGGIVVAPAGPPFGPLGPAAPAAPAAAAAPAVAAPEVAVATPAPVETRPRPAPRARGNPAPVSPTAEQLAAIPDPAMRAEAMRDAGEWAERAVRTQGLPSTLPPGADAEPGPAVQPPPAAAAPGAPAADVQVARNDAAPAVAPAVQAGYAAFNAGDLATARQQYAAALRNNPNNRDALLGSAAVALRERRDDEAAGYYSRLLALNPRDVEAIAGLTALRPGDGDRAEVRLRGVLRNHPESAPVLFALGNLYARQGRWQEAQQAYFRAWSAAPANADYAFNLAIGLDRLNQGRLARDYYQRALALAAAGGATFDRAAVQRRLQELAPAGDAVPAAPSASAPAPAPGN